LFSGCKIKEKMRDESGGRRKKIADIVLPSRHSGETLPPKRRCRFGANTFTLRQNGTVELAETKTAVEWKQ